MLKRACTDGGAELDSGPGKRPCERQRSADDVDHRDSRDQEDLGGSLLHADAMLDGLFNGEASAARGQQTELELPPPPALPHLQQLQQPVPELQQQPVPELQQPPYELQQPVPELQQPPPELQQPPPELQQPPPELQQPPLELPLPPRELPQPLPELQQQPHEHCTQAGARQPWHRQQVRHDARHCLSCKARLTAGSMHSGCIVHACDFWGLQATADVHHVAALMRAAAGG